MPNATVTVAYVNPPKPGKKMGSIKDTNDEYYGVYPEKLSLFQKGGTYEIDYLVQGDFKKVRDVKPAGGMALSGGTTQNGNGGNYRPTSPVDAERMYVCSLVNAGIQAGRIDFTEGAIEAATNAARNAWRNTFGAVTPLNTPAPPVRGRSDMDDDIPFSPEFR